MKNIRTIEDANAALLPYVPLVAQLTGKDMMLERIRPLMAAVGNPQDKIRIVHIAGTSGKTSTAYYVAALLQQTGQRVGLTVSPHIDSVTERVQIDGKPLAVEEFCYYLSEFLAIVEQMAKRPSYFELLYAFSFYVFADKKVDYAVVETGMGGLHDATNIAQAPNKVCIITDIGYDHMHILGDTLEKIATQKAGIIHEGNEVFTYQQGSDAMRPIIDRAAAKKANLHVLPNQLGNDYPDNMPDFQRRNWTLAYATFQFLKERDKLPNLSEQQLLNSQRLQVPARMEVINHNGKLFIMDGAHNLQKMTTFFQSFQHTYPNVKPAVLLALKQGKESQNLGKLLASHASSVIVTAFKTSQDLPAISIEPHGLADSLRHEGVQNAMVEPDQHKAFLKLMEQPEKICIITGSFYLLSQLRAGEGLV